MPIQKINGHWYGHEENINEFLKLITHPGKTRTKDGLNIDLKCLENILLMINLMLDRFLIRE